ncbi:hypothetical protein [Bacillus chungangensis]|uniref:Transposase n=1 Tax=Bacillus chungangensis TaxID=587633 RepID=A0ABT9WN30_9BACI|nr:hypothetical protein [Bacillus chungangensis]MDQ0174683.1 hypothetical protein [Bacillus chungangensis]
MSEKKQVQSYMGKGTSWNIHHYLIYKEPVIGFSIKSSNSGKNDSNTLLSIFELYTCQASGKVKREKNIDDRPIFMPC